MLTRSLPFLPIISPRLMYLERLLFTFPRTILRNRWRSCPIFCPTALASVDRVGHRLEESYQTGGVGVKRSRRSGLESDRARPARSHPAESATAAEARGASQTGRAPVSPPPGDGRMGV